VLVWVYYSAQILLYGAEFTQVYANRMGARIQPAPDARVADEKKAAPPETAAAEAARPSGHRAA
jgi:membrane protein